MVSWLLCHWDSRLDWLAQALESMRQQELDDKMEFVIVDDGSSSHKAHEDLEAYSRVDDRIRPFRKDHEGLAKALNYGLDRCIGDLVARLDADDMALPKRLATQKKYLVEQGLDVVGGGAILWLENGARRTVNMPVREDPMTYLSAGRVPVLHPTVVFRKESVLSVGGYPEGYPHAEDYALWTIMAHRNRRIGNVHEVVSIMRRHDESMSSTHGEEQRESRDRARKEL